MSMLVYIGTKLVMAETMSRLEYNVYRGWKVPADENPADAGYLVEYLNSPPNVEGRKGYVSWSPAAQFEAAYLGLEDVTEKTPDWLIRVVAEKAQLDDKMKKLDLYRSTQHFADLPEDDRTLLTSQLRAMQDYSTVLGLRLGSARKKGLLAE